MICLRKIPLTLEQNSARPSIPPYSPPSLDSPLRQRRPEGERHPEPGHLGAEERRRGEGHDAVRDLGRPGGLRRVGPERGRLGRSPGFQADPRQPVGVNGPLLKNELILGFLRPGCAFVLLLLRFICIFFVVYRLIKLF